MTSPRVSGDTLLATDLHVEATYRLTEALVESEARMRRRVELLTEIVFETDAAGGIVFLNGAWAQAMLQAVNDCLGRRWVEFVHPDDVPAVVQLFAAATAGKVEPDRPLVRMNRADGGQLWMELSVSPLPGGGAVGVLHDVTRQKRAQDELAKVSMVANFTENLVVITDAQGRTEWVNRAFTERTGFALADIVGLKPGRLLQGAESDPAVVRNIGAALRDGRSIRTELTNYTKAGQPYWVQLQITPIRNAAGEIEQFVSVQSDASDRHRAELEIRALNTGLEKRVQERALQLAQFKLALDRHGLVLISDAHGVITYVNDRVCEISGFAREELVGGSHRLLNSGHHPSSFFDELWRTVRAGQVWHGEICNRTRDGAPLWVDTTIVPFVNEAGVPDQFISIQTDVTERRIAEERVTQLYHEVEASGVQLREANSELESFAYSVSHDLRAPLRHIHGYLDMLRRATSGQLSEKAERYVQTAADASVQMGRLIDDLLAFSRMGQAEMHLARVDLDGLVRDVIAGLTIDGGGQVEWEIAPLPHVAGDAAMLRQVLVNLIGNAVKYSGKRDVQRVSIRPAGVEDGRMVFAVRDNGAGFDMAYVDKLFGVFQRLHHENEFEGTGIGLAIVRRIVQRHGGRIWAESAPDQGATFYFTLALAGG